MISLPPSPGDQLMVLATKVAHLLRLTRYPPTTTAFYEKPQSFYLH